MAATVMQATALLDVCPKHKVQGTCHKPSKSEWDNTAHIYPNVVADSSDRHLGWWINVLQLTWNSHMHI